MSRSPVALVAAATCLLAAALTSFAADEEPRPPRHEDGALVPVPWALPKPGSCSPQGGLRGWPPGQDAPPVPFQPGETFGIDELATLEDFLPHFIWENRDKFFYEGMRLEIGNCFADYSPPDFFQSATAQHAGQPKLDTEGGLRDYTVGLPYPPDRLDPMDPAAGLKWAWNFELRYQAAGFWGKFRTTDMVGRDGRAEPFVGEIFRAQTMFRSDLPKEDYKASGVRGKHWVGGGLMFEPFDARHYSWRQYRDTKHMTEPSRTDDLHAYLPDFRRVRRVSAAGIEGILIATLAGWCLPVPPVIFFPIVAVLLKAGAGGAQLTALVAAWNVFAFHRTLAMELPVMGRYFVTLRLASSVLIPPLAGLTAILLTGAFAPPG